MAATDIMLRAKAIWDELILNEKLNYFLDLQMMYCTEGLTRKTIAMNLQNEFEFEPKLTEAVYKELIETHGELRYAEIKTSSIANAAYKRLYEVIPTVNKPTELLAIIKAYGASTNRAMEQTDIEDVKIQQESLMKLILDSKKVRKLEDITAPPEGGQIDET